MNRQEILELLKERKISYEMTEHEAIFNMEEAGHVKMPYPDAEAKNLFLRDDKKRNWYLVTVRGDRKLDLKWFQSEFGTRRLSFASDADLMKYLHLIPGAVTPFGLLNDETCSVQFFLDRTFENQMILFQSSKNMGILYIYSE